MYTVKELQTDIITVSNRFGMLALPCMLLASSICFGQTIDEKFNAISDISKFHQITPSNEPASDLCYTKNGGTGMPSSGGFVFVSDNDIKDVILIWTPNSFKLKNASKVTISCDFFLKKDVPADAFLFQTGLSTAATDSICLSGVENISFKLVQEELGIGRFLAASKSSDGTSQQYTNIEPTFSLPKGPTWLQLSVELKMVDSKAGKFEYKLALKDLGDHGQGTQTPAVGETSGKITFSRFSEKAENYFFFRVVSSAVKGVDNILVTSSNSR